MKPKTVVGRTVSEHEESNDDSYRETEKSDAAYGLNITLGSTIKDSITCRKGHEMGILKQDAQSQDSRGEW